MSDPLLFSRVRVRRDAPIAALRSLLIPNDENARFSAAHQLVWTLFADRADRERDFLWREAEPGQFFILSHRAPADTHGLFDVDPPKAFAPVLAAGMLLRFSLRANATVAKQLRAGKRGVPCDVVMDALRAVPLVHRARERPRIAADAGRTWLSSQGEKAGFSLTKPGADATVIPGTDAQVMSYRQLHLKRRGSAAAHVSVIDFEGVLRIDDAALFLAKLAAGFGRAKAFGCGLMLIKRA